MHSTKSSKKYLKPNQVVHVSLFYSLNNVFTIISIQDLQNSAEHEKYEKYCKVGIKTKHLHWELSAREKIWLEEFFLSPIWE